MKKIYASIIFIIGFSIISNARVSTDTSLSPILAKYYDVKNALANSDAATASKKAAELLTAIKNIDANRLPADEQKVFQPLQDKLSYDARHISEVQDISHQREHFANLSLNIFSLAKGIKLTSQPVYEDYCPMKKAYWVTDDTTIKNPYFGKSMLDCGSVTATIK